MATEPSSAQPDFTCVICGQDTSLGHDQGRHDSAVMDLRAKRDHLLAREAHFARVLGVVDGGQYRYDWDAAIERVVSERDRLAEDLGQISAMLLPDEGPPVQGVHAILDELRIAREERGRLAAENEKLRGCDCVPTLVSSKTCRKCGRRGTIPQAQFLGIGRELHHLRESLIAFCEDVKAWCDENSDDEPFPAFGALHERAELVAREAQR